MYNFSTLKGFLFAAMVICTVALFIHAVVLDKKAKDKLIRSRQSVRATKTYLNCVEKSLAIYDVNVSLTKLMINSSIEGIFRGAIFGYVMARTEGALVGAILFSIMNPMLTYITEISSLDAKLI